MDHRTFRRRCGRGNMEWEDGFGVWGPHYHDFAGLRWLKCFDVFCKRGQPLKGASDLTAISI